MLVMVSSAPLRPEHSDRRCSDFIWNFYSSKEKNIFHHSRSLNLTCPATLSPSLCQSVWGWLREQLHWSHVHSCILWHFGDDKEFRDISVFLQASKSGKPCVWLCSHFLSYDVAVRSFLSASSSSHPSWLLCEFLKYDLFLGGETKMYVDLAESLSVIAKDASDWTAVQEAGATSVPNMCLLCFWLHAQKAENVVVIAPELLLWKCFSWFFASFLSLKFTSNQGTCWCFESPLKADMNPDLEQVTWPDSDSPQGIIPKHDDGTILKLLWRRTSLNQFEPKSSVVPTVDQQNLNCCLH